MEKSTWKILAIIFIILFILETLIFFTILSMGLKSIEKEERCSNDICAYSDYFSYDDYYNMCYCYDKEGNETIRKFMG